METLDKQFSLKIGGRINSDWSWIDEDLAVQNKLGDQTSGSEFRRARLYLSGDLYGNLAFKSQFDFAGSKTVLKDVFVEVKKLPGIGNVKAGHHKEPFSLEMLTSSNYLTFIERALPNAFSPSRNTGLSIYNSQLSQRITWAAGIYRDTDNSGISMGDGVGGSFRFTGLPILSQEKDYLAHLGLSYTIRKPSNNVLRWRQRPELHLADHYVDTASIQANRVNQLAFEASVVSGPFSVQSEYTYSSARSITSRDINFWGFYAYASFFLTGEHRNYKPSSASFDRLRPKRNFGPGKGPGAWEVALRYSVLDLTNGPIQGGRLSNITTAVNWHLNPIAKVLFNYVFGDLHQVGDTHALVTRLQLNF